MSLDFYLRYKVDENNITVFDINITHNLGSMAQEAGIYNALWRPDEHGYKIAKDITKILEDGLKKLQEDPGHYEKFNAENGWGLYKHFVPFVENVLAACKQYPNAQISTWR